MTLVIDTRIAYIHVLGATKGKRIGIVKFNETGYYFTTLDDPSMSGRQVTEHVHNLNDAIGVPDSVAESMYGASMFGWHVPAAAPAVHFWSQKPNA